MKQTALEPDKAQQAYCREFGEAAKETSLLPCIAEDARQIAEAGLEKKGHIFLQ